jgi:hypothetical protein
VQSAIEALERFRGRISVESVPVDASGGESFDVPPGRGRRERNRPAELA